MPATTNTGRGKKKAAAVVVAPAAAPEAPALESAPPEPTANTIVEVAAPAPAAPAPKKKAAAKKSVKVVAVVTPDGIEGSFAPEPRRPLIAHLQIRTNDIVFHDQVLRYDPNPPTEAEVEPYDAAESDVFKVSQEHIPNRGAIAEPEEGVEAAEKEGEKEAPAAAAAPVAKAMPCFVKSDLMVQFRGAAEKKCLPASVDIACFWCAHPFEGMPCVVPEREVAGVYSVYGNFCCPECAVAYLLGEGIDPHVRWERLALLHRVYDAEGAGRIFPAPPREALKLFGGPMSIETYRATVREKRVRVDLHMPPMVSILGSIDTKPIDFFDTNLKAGAGVVAAPAARSVEEGLRLKRSKPLKDKESTLDTVMNIKITSARGGGMSSRG